MPIRPILLGHPARAVARGRISVRRRRMPAPATYHRRPRGDVVRPPLWSVADKDVTAVEGLGSASRPHPLQRASREQAMHEAIACRVS